MEQHLTPERGLKLSFRLPSQAGNSGRISVVSTQGASSVRDNVVTVFGSRTVEGLDAFNASLDDKNDARATG